MTGPIDALLDRWRARAARLRREGLAYPRGSYEDGAAKGAARALEAAAREVEDVVTCAGSSFVQGRDAEESR